ncbi:N-acetyl-gamma-glutamyl-phosphate reductase [Glaciecola sp. MH2013]|uniref:N-acetyl-gamma-glutamyl-phosphate reductase n=1 Tax=Glaciecola sp. MH2013 TaxID=2785524 RepID=UPI00189D9EF8|nr:N-acetyl-gamma-glutamyl-phosphate reductase [Glaciecola sp. MH2013]MBF7073785.1 N-acetyl-gamma-glutamyl-phosphate reductase [Glaciecola sp. MH2013]
MYSTCIIGASGYTGAELIALVNAHPLFTLSACFVSENSSDANKAISEVHPHLTQVTSSDANELHLQALNAEALSRTANDFDLIFLATPHEASHDWADSLIRGKAKVFDLSGAFRISDTAIFAEYYGFEHKQKELLSEAVYGLAEWHEEQIARASFVAVPGCYPTASLLALKPLADAGVVDSKQRPVINATSGVSGAGKKPSATTNFFEVSLQAYGVLGHRHTPEIEEYANTKVIFTPHLGQFKRGILATVTVAIKDGVSADDIDALYINKYASSDIVRLRKQWPKIDDVAHTPFCDLHWKFDENSRYLVVTSVIDNLLKGAASQALQCANIASGLHSATGLLPSFMTTATAKK